MSGESFAAQALCGSVDQHAVRVGTASGILARMSTIVSNVRFRTEASFFGVANGVSWAVVIFGTRYNGDTPYTRVGIGDGSLWTGTFVRTFEIFTNSAFSTGVWFRALVNVVALTACVSGESRWTLAAEATGKIRARSVHSAPSVRPLSGIALVDINATSRNVIRVEGPSFFADTKRFLSFGFAVRVLATLDIRTRCLALNPRWCSNKSSFAVTSERSGRVDTHRRRSAHVRVHPTFVDIDAARALRFESVLAEALPLDTFRVVGTVKVALAEHVNVRLLASDLRVRLAGVTLRAQTVVARVGVLADGVVAARLVERRTLVDVDAAPKWISRVFWLT